jgi:hypothetical protein
MLHQNNTRSLVVMLASSKSTACKMQQLRSKALKALIAQMLAMVALVRFNYTAQTGNM